MVKSTKIKFSRQLLLLISFALLFCLIACGGSKDTDTGSNSTTTSVASLTLSVPSSITYPTPVTVTAILRDANGALVQGAVVTFSAASSLVAFDPSSATALTDVNGTASITLNAADSTSEGATSISASAPVTTSGTTTTVTSAPVGIAVHKVSNLSSLILSVPSSVTYPTQVTATAVLRDASGALANNVIVTFSAANSSLVAFTSSTAITVAGSASVNLSAAGISSTGATYISASAPITVGGVITTITSTPVAIAVNGASITLDTPLTLSPSSISAFGTSSISVPVLVNGSPATVPISVTFSSPCATAGKAQISSPVTSILGTATSTYTDNGCAGDDVITASITGYTRSATLTVAAPAANNIQFVSATPEIIGTKTVGAASLSKSSVVKFKVVNSSNLGMAGVVVDFSLLPANVPGGVSLSATQATSDSNGEITTAVTSGTVPTPVWVVATVHSTPTIFSQSNVLTITTGLPTQDFFSLSVQTYNIEGWVYDGVTSTLTVIASDRLGNPVPDGTAINFVTEGCQIQPASCTTASGTCTVTFRSAELRPSDGRVTILAYAVGEKSFVDGNGNNIYDASTSPAETFYDLGDLYIDANENGTWDTGEQFYLPYSSAGSVACQSQPGGTALPGNYADVPSKTNTCTGTWGNNYVRRDTVIVLSGSVPTISPDTVTMGSKCIKSINLTLKDVNNNPMPEGTTIAIGTNHVYFTPSGATSASTAAVTIDAGSPVLNTNIAGGTIFRLTVDGGTSCYAPFPPVAFPEGFVNVIITTPKGLVTPFVITVNP
jgi:hypothetical protein